ncbi:hypothetical protein niasHT_022012 [Heterodera trifolii]|uniref:Uncharacterized protein n=1 Tax=Heterodera trifolii TaxID=157864 RepID=A0ABD2JBT4_9BILA
MFYHSQKGLRSSHPGLFASALPLNSATSDCAALFTKEQLLSNGLDLVQLNFSNFAPSVSDQFQCCWQFLRDSSALPSLNCLASTISNPLKNGAQPMQRPFVGLLLLVHLARRFVFFVQIQFLKGKKFEDTTKFIKMRRNGGKAANAAANGGQRPPVNRIQLLTATNGQKQRHGKRGQQTMKSYGDGRRRAGKADPNFWE